MPHGPGDTASRRRLFVCQPTGPGDEEACAERILAALLRRAYRRSVTEADLEKPGGVTAGPPEGDFESAIEMALSPRCS